jgi:hypothetical protein
LTRTHRGGRHQHPDGERDHQTHHVGHTRHPWIGLPPIQPVGELVAAALTSDQDARWDYTGLLHLRGDRETFDAARALRGDADPTWRTLGVDILGQLGAVTLGADGTTAVVPVEERPFRAPAVPLLLGLVASEEDPGVLRSCFGLYQTGRDTPGIRAALFARVADTDVVTRAEALRALAHLGDARAAGPIAAALADTEIDDETGEVADSSRMRATR